MGAPTGTQTQDQETMGRNSWHRSSSIKRNKKQATKAKVHKRQQPSFKHKYTQRAVDNLEEEAFNPKKHCRICVAKAKGKVIKRAHDVRCGKNKKTRGESEATVNCERDTTRLAKIMNAKMRSPENERQVAGTGTPSIATAFPAMKMANSRIDPIGTIKPLDMIIDCGGWISPSSTPHDIARFLDRQVKKRLSEGYEKLNINEVCDVPPAFAALAMEIMLQVKHKKPTGVGGISRPEYVPTEKFSAAAKRFHAIFGYNNMVYTVPQMTDLRCGVSPEFHSLTGAKFIYMDIELAFPEYQLCCPKCGSSKLTRERDIFSYGRRFFPIADDRFEIWCLAFRYRCQDCPKDTKDSDIFFTNDGEFLAKVPAYIRNQYPVDPRYAQPNRRCHLSKRLSDQLREDMASFSSASEFVRKVGRRRHELYLERCEDYYSLPTIKERYLDINQVVRTYPPADQECRNIYLEAQTSMLNPEQMSSKDRYERELQMTQIEELGAGDHTFETLKNYTDLPGAKAIYTVMNEIGQICNMAIVGSQSMKEVAHMFRMMLTKRGPRKQTNKRVFYTDTWPNDAAFYKKVFGDSMEGRLGLFHFLTRLIEHLCNKDPRFYRVKDKLQQCIYRYNQEDYEAVIDAIGRRLFSSNGLPLTPTEIEAIRLSKQWHQNYTKYIKKEIRSWDEIARYLDEFILWVEEMFAVRDEAGQVQHDKEGNVKVDESIFKSSWARMKHQIALNKQTARYIQDPEGIEMYYKVPAGEKSKHQLATYISKKPECKLEGFHGEMKHYSNTGMRPPLADVLTLQGATEFNHRKYIKYQKSRNVETAEADRQFMPGYLENQPVFYNHAMLDHLNKVASAKGFAIHFPNCMKLPANNGERFLSESFLQQQVRNEKKVWTKDGMCGCSECVDSPPAELELIDDEATCMETDEKGAETDSMQCVLIVESPSKDKRSSKPVVDMVPMTAPQMPPAQQPPPARKKVQMPPAQQPAPTLQQQVSLNPLVQLPPMSPFPFLQLPSAIQTLSYHQQAPYFHRPPVQMDSPEACCKPYKEYLEYAEKEGKKKKGRRPHSPSCRNRGIYISTGKK